MYILLAIAFVIVHTLAVASGIAGLRGDAQGIRVMGCFGLLSAITVYGLISLMNRETVLYLAIGATVLGLFGGFVMNPREDL